MTDQNSNSKTKHTTHGTFLGVHPAWSMGVVLIIAIIIMFQMI